MRLIEGPRPKIVITDAPEIVMRCCGPLRHCTCDIAQLYSSWYPLYGKSCLGRARFVMTYRRWRQATCWLDKCVILLQSPSPMSGSRNCPWLAGEMFAQYRFKLKSDFIRLTIALPLFDELAYIAIKCSSKKYRIEDDIFRAHDPQDCVQDYKCDTNSSRILVKQPRRYRPELACSSWLLK